VAAALGVHSVPAYRTPSEHRFALMMLLAGPAAGAGIGIIAGILVAIRPPRPRIPT
jgi:hypothetical protein